MQPFRVYILGCGSALPTPKHGASAQVVEIRDKMFLVDCGEGTQTQLRRSHINFMRIQAVFISHLHGDHCFGLIGLISTFGMLGRTAPLHVYATPELQPMLESQIRMFCNGLEYEVVFHAVDASSSAVIYEDRSLTVASVPLNHRVACCGFLFREKQGMPHIRRDMVDYLNIPVSQINNIKAGAGWTTEDGTFYPHERLVTPPDRARSYAYCSDTKYMPGLCKRLVDVDTLYHESTYCEDNAKRAALYYHSTARQAATVARDAGVKKLLLGHYSARYNDEGMILKEAREIFPQSYLTHENDVFDV